MKFVLYDLTHSSMHTDTETETESIKRTLSKIWVDPNCFWDRFFFFLISVRSLQFSNYTTSSKHPVMQMAYIGII